MKCSFGRFYRHINDLAMFLSLTSSSNYVREERGKKMNKKMKMKKIYNKIKNNNKGHIHILQFSIQILHYKLHMTNFSV